MNKETIISSIDTELIWKNELTFFESVKTDDLLRIEQQNEKESLLNYKMEQILNQDEIDIIV